MEETVIEIPEASPEEGWQPPVVTSREIGPQTKIQRYTDVFFIQYVVCMLLVTAFLVINLLDRSLGDSLGQTFLSRCHAPTNEQISELFLFLQNQWK